jgi:hypothetical protein
MQGIPINLWALVVAALAKMALGSLWYAPFAYGPHWMAAAGVSPAQMKAALPKAMLADLLGSLVTALILMHVVRYAGADSVVHGATMGFLCWLGFVAATTLAAVFYEGRPFKLFLINNGFLLFSLMVMGAIIGAWH